jgi:hypothetical protein
MVSFGKSHGRSHGFSLARSRDRLAGKPGFQSAVPLPLESGFDDGDSTAWRSSSLELKRGLLVSEEPMDTLPGDLLDAFFRR